MLNHAKKRLFEIYRLFESASPFRISYKTLTKQCVFVEIRLNCNVFVKTSARAGCDNICVNKGGTYMGKIIALTGASGNMGLETVMQLMESGVVEKLKVLLLNERRERKCAKEWKRKYGGRIEVIFGDLAEKEDCRKLVANSDYVLNLAAVIPPTADHYPVLQTDVTASVQ